VNQTEFKNVDPPFWVAWNQAKASIRVRFFRQLITSIGIALGIAFLCSMLTMSAAGAGDRSSDQTAWLVGTSLVMCLVGVTNSMLMSVTERFREIGTIKCLGASDGFIVKVFFLEALLLGVIGSLMGSLAGTGLMAAAVAKIPLSTGLGIVLIGTLTGAFLTVLAAIAPAIQASRMPAAAALRVEI
jgi:ABC-type antimicrobial peptide transport system permease subunit